MSEVIPEGWVIESLGSLAGKITSGATPKVDNPSYYGGTVPFLKIDDITSLRGRYVHTAKQFITDQALNETSAKLFPPGTVLTTMYGTIGSTAILGKAMATNQAIAAFIDLQNTTSEYLYQLLTFEAPKLASSASQTTQANISGAVLKEYSVSVPPLPEQKKIATILSSVDDVIEKTRAQIDKLKDLKTGMMQELLTQGIGHKEFKDSPLGRIPASWDVLPLNHLAVLSRGRFSHRPRNDPMFYGGQYPFLQTGDIPKDSILIKSYSQSLNEKGYGVSKLFPKGTLVITIAATIGEVGILDFDACFPDSLVGISVKNEIANANYLAYTLRYFSADLNSLAPQTAQKNINLEVLNPFEVPMPPLIEQRLIAAAIGSVDARMEDVLNKLRQATDLKKALMQDLLTGKVRVKPDSQEVAAA